MKIKDMTKAELELLSHCDMAAMLLKENGKPMNTPTIFKSICNLLDFSDEEYADKIGEFYTSLTTDKRFILLDNAEWDLRDNHAVKINIDDDDDDADYEEEIDEDEASEVEPEEATTDEIEEPIDDEDLDVDDEDGELDDLSIVDEEDIDA